MLEGWLARGLEPRRVVVLDPNPAGALREKAEAVGFRLNPDLAAVEPPDVVVLGIKPQALGEVAPSIRGLVGPETLLVSILAGKRVQDLSAALPGARALVRAMPNLPASLGRGATGLFASDGVSPRQRELAEALLSAVGIVEWVADEELVDSVTAVSGSGPAYVFHLVECLAAAARDVGIDGPVAERLARETVIGAGQLLAASDLEPGELRRNVTSPGGTTEAALQVLMGDAGLAGLMRETVLAAKRRAGELSG